MCHVVLLWLIIPNPVEMSEKKDKGKDPEDGVSRSKSRSDSKGGLKASAEEKKQAIDEVEDELSESEEEDDATPADKAGYIEIGKKKDKFKTVYAILNGGSLFYYKDIRVRAHIFLRKLLANCCRQNFAEGWRFLLLLCIVSYLPLFL